MTTGLFALESRLSLPPCTSEFPTIPSELFFSQNLSSGSLKASSICIRSESRAFQSEFIKEWDGKNRSFPGTLELKIWTKDRARGKDIDPARPPARVSLLASHDHVDTLRTCKRSNRDFYPAIQSTGNTDHSLFYSLPLYYAGSSKVLPRVFSPLGRTEKQCTVESGDLLKWPETWSDCYVSNE